MSRWPPIADAITGVPQAMASRLAMPNGSYQDTSTIRSADRSRAGMSSWLTWPANLTRSAMPRRPASRARSQHVFVLAQHRPRRAADDQQLRVGDVGQRAHGRLQAVPAQVGGHRDQPRPLRARRDGAFGAEPDGVHAERHHAEPWSAVRPGR